ncbi:MAG: SDR family oxidoreductase [bacterium]|nr:SDR family oxidoreductase [bacterium]
MGRLQDKVIIVTGATSGIGRVGAKMMAAEGAKVVAAGRRQEKGDSLIEEIKAAGGEAIFVKTDVTVDADCDALVQAAIDKYGRIDCVWNNAGSGPMVPFEKLDFATDYKDMMDVNLRADFYLTQAAIPQMLKQGKGDFIYTTSIGATQGSIYLQTYSAAKAGTVQLAKGIALEYGTRGIRANAIMPGPIRSEMTYEGSDVEKMFTPMLCAGRIGNPEEVGYLAIFLASDEARFLTGTAITIDGGLTTGMYVFPQVD